MVTMVTIDMVWISLVRQLLILIWKRVFRRVRMVFEKGTSSPIIDGLALDFCYLHNVSLGGKVGISCILISDGRLPDWVKRILNNLFLKNSGNLISTKLNPGAFFRFMNNAKRAASQNEDWGWYDTISKLNNHKKNWKLSCNNNNWMTHCILKCQNCKMRPNKVKLSLEEATSVTAAEEVYSNLYGRILLTKILHWYNPSCRNNE